MKKFWAMLLTILMLASVLTVSAFAADSSAVKVSVATTATDIKKGDSFTVTLSHSAMTTKTFTCGLTFDTTALEVMGISTAAGYNAVIENSVIIEPQLSTVAEANASGAVGFGLVRITDTTVAAGDILTVTFKALQEVDSTSITPYQDSDGTDNTAGRANGTALDLVIRSAFTGIKDGLYYKDGALKKNAGVVEVDKKLYYIDANGAVKTGLVFISANKTNNLLTADRYYFNEDGSLAKGAGVVTYSGSTYFIGTNGAASQGIVYVSTAKGNGIITEPGAYYFNSYGKLQPGAGVVTSGDDYYYISTTGKTRSGVLNVTKGALGTGRFYFGGTNGKLLKLNSAIKIGSVVYFVDSTGKCLTGVVAVSAEQLNGVLPEAGSYYFDEYSKLRAYVGVVTQGEDTYYITAGGRAMSGLIKLMENKCNDILSPGKHYFLPGSGKLAKGYGALVDNGSVYYITETGAAAEGIAMVTEDKLNGIISTPGAYYFNAYRKLQPNAGMMAIGDDYYFVGVGGKLGTGIISVPKGAMGAGRFYFGEDYKLVKDAGMVSYSGGLYYVDEMGRSLDGLLSVSAEKCNNLLAEAGIYYFNQYGKLQPSAGVVASGDDYYFIGSTGKAGTGVVTVSKGPLGAGKFYFGPDGKLAKNAGVVSSNNSIYFIDADGSPVSGIVTLTDAQTNGLLNGAGTYYFGSDGKLKNYAYLIQVDDDYYYIGAKGQAMTGTINITETKKSHELLPLGSYTFGGDGKMVNPPV